MSHVVSVDTPSPAWTPCREAVQEEPQSEGLVFDAANDAPVPDGTPEEVNGYEVDGATQFLFVNFAETLRALRN